MYGLALPDSMESLSVLQNLNLASRDLLLTIDILYSFAEAARMDDLELTDKLHKVWKRHA